MATGRSRPADGGYVPDPERDTAAVIDGFFVHFASGAWLIRAARPAGGGAR